MADRIKVLSVCTSDTTGGAARAAYRIHKAEKALGMDSRMFVKNKGTSDGDVIALAEFIPKNPLYGVFGWVRNKIKNQWQHFQWDRYPGRLRVFMSDMRSEDIHGALKRLDYDVLHLHWTNLRFLPLEELPKNKPIVWTLHDSWAFCGVCHYFFDCERFQQDCGCCPLLRSDSPRDLSHTVWAKKRRVYEGLDLHVVTPSRWLGECAKKSSLLGHFPVSVIPNCVDTDRFRPLDGDEISPRWRNLQKESSGKSILLYGAMNATTDRIKGFSNLMSALQILEKQGKEETFELVVFGADKSLEGMPASLPVHYVGYVFDETELASLYSLASLVVVPSSTENLSCTIMESLSCGTPVTAFNVGGNSDLIEHKRNGYLAFRNSDEDLANGILWCLENNKGGELGRAGREKVVREYTPFSVSSRYKHLYESII